jgi:hypothetical protein
MMVQEVDDRGRVSVRAEKFEVVEWCVEFAIRVRVTAQ